MVVKHVPVRARTIDDWKRTVRADKGNHVTDSAVSHANVRIKINPYLPSSGHCCQLNRWRADYGTTDSYRPEADFPTDGGIALKQRGWFVDYTWAESGCPSLKFWQTAGGYRKLSITVIA